MNFSFDETTHTYRMENGEILPSVTSVLKDMGFYGNAEAWFTEESATRGTYIHRLIQYYLEGTLDECTIDDALLPYFHAWQHFEADTGFAPMEIEKAMVSETHRFAGTVDYVGVINGKCAVIDLKTSTAAAPAEQLQTAAYRQLLQENPGQVMQPTHRFSLHVSSAGKYKLIEHSDRSDRNVFIAAVSIWHWKKNHGIGG